MDAGGRLREALKAVPNAEIERKLTIFFNAKCTQVIKLLEEWLFHTP